MNSAVDSLPACPVVADARHEAPDFARDYRAVLRNAPTSVCVVSALDGEGRPFGRTIGSFASLSLDPPLIMWSLQRSSSALEAFCAAKHFAISVLSEAQEDISAMFATGRTDPFLRADTSAGINGLLLIEGAAAWIECEAHSTLSGGDRVILLGQVLRARLFARPPLLHWMGSYAEILKRA